MDTTPTNYTEHLELAQPGNHKQPSRRELRPNQQQRIQRSIEALDANPTPQTRARRIRIQNAIERLAFHSLVQGFLTGAIAAAAIALAWYLAAATR